MTFKGGCNAEVFNTWFEEVLLPVLPKNSKLILDNAAFHKSAKTLELAMKAGCTVMFLPTYSPDLNGPVVATQVFVWRSKSSLLISLF